MEVLTEPLEPLVARLIILKNLDSYIQESVYYRTHANLFLGNKHIIWSFGFQDKKTKIL